MEAPCLSSCHSVLLTLRAQRLGEQRPNKSSQRTFDPPPIFASAKMGVASNAAELRRWAALRNPI
jgi:hypothetical protein